MFHLFAGYLCLQLIKAGSEGVQLGDVGHCAIVVAAVTRVVSTRYSIGRRAVLACARQWRTQRSLKTNEFAGIKVEFAQCFRWVAANVVGEGWIGGESFEYVGQRGHGCHPITGRLFCRECSVLNQSGRSGVSTPAI